MRLAPRIFKLLLFSPCRTENNNPVVIVIVNRKDWRKKDGTVWSRGPASNCVWIWFVVVVDTLTKSEKVYATSRAFLRRLKFFFLLNGVKAPLLLVRLTNLFSSLFGSHWSVSSIVHTAYSTRPEGRERILVYSNESESPRVKAAGVRRPHQSSSFFLFPTHQNWARFKPNSPC